MLSAVQAAVFSALRFDDSPEVYGRRWEPLRGLPEKEWKGLASFCDRTQLTLPLLDACSAAQAGVLPPAIRERFEQAARNTAIRTGRVREAFAEIHNRLDQAALEFVVLKGFANAPLFFPDPRRRVQYDLDLYLPSGGAERAAAAVRDLGYEPLQSMEAFPTDHLPVMIRRTGWQWRGDFFDPEIPISLDIHFRLWDEETERIAAPGWPDFWNRRVTRDWEGRGFGCFREADLLGYHCLHLLRHLLRGSLRLSHVWELAYFLNRRVGADGTEGAENTGDAFWREWLELHPPELRRLQAVTFALAHRWFGCALPPVAKAEIAALEPEIRAWIEEYGWSPVEAIDSPNKHELWLHLSLAGSAGARASVLRRRLLPMRLPGPVDAVYVPELERTPAVRWRSRALYARHLAKRGCHHTRALPGVIWHGSKWAWRGSAAGQLEAGYWSFLAAATCFNLGAFVFFVLYNLYLLEIGYQENVLGFAASAMTAGSIAGTLPAAALLRRAGVRPGLLICFAVIAAASVGRVIFASEPALFSFAFIAGTAFSLFAVAVAPTIAGLTTEATRPRGFSVFFAVGIGLGIVGGLLAGWLPGVLGSTRAALLAGCGLMGAAAIPAFFLRSVPGSVAEARTFPRGSFIRRFLVIVAVWTGAIGAFSPFFNAFFSRQYEASVEQIGAAYSFGQAMQVAGILAAPFLLRRLGLARGVALTQVASGAALAGLLLIPSSGSGLAAGALAYAGFMGLHYMGEPGLYSLLMNGVKPAERSGASALHSLAMFSAQAVAVALSGIVVAQAGYAPVIFVASLLAAVSAFLLWRILPGR